MESKLFKSLSYIRADFPWSFGKLTITQTFKNLIIQIQNVVKQAKGISLLNVFSLFHFLWVASRRMTWLLSWTGLPLSIRYLSPSFQAQREPDLREHSGVTFIRALIPLLRGALSLPNHFPKPHLQIPSHWWLGFSLLILEWHTHSV